MPKNTPSRALTGVAGLVESYGQDPGNIARRVGLEPLALYRHDIYIEGSIANDFLEEAARVCGDRFFSLKLAPLQGWGVLGPVSPMIRQAQTVGGVLRMLEAHQESHTRDSSSLLVEDDRGVSICYELRWTPGSGRSLHSSRVQLVELACAIFCHEIRKLLGNSWRPDLAQFRYSAPEDLRPLRQICGDRLMFNQDVNALRISKADCERPIVNMPDRSPINALLETPTGLDLKTPFVLEVDRTIRLLLNRDDASVDRVAQTLGISGRTLQHRLKQSDTSYQNLFDIARIDLALQYFNDSDLNVLAISERLGFTDTAAFSRFFKKHLKMSPRDYTKRISSGA
ncbi:MAG: AraC family transcriptional regulator [Halieaceae bacterium]|nr:AraC family transcriptional regulator [Halieaceae bacterium]MCP4843384.1 AraC family transcriptional regulator [Halieaceae bacterium]